MKYSLTPPALRTVGAILLGLAAASQCHIAQAKDSFTPCNAAAEHLREFAARNPNLATSDQRFPFNALASENVSSSVAFVPSSDGFEDLDAVERAINPVTVDVAMREFLRNKVGDSGTSYWYVKDARHFDNLLSIYQIGGSAHCEGGVIFDTADGLLIPLYLYGGEETCDGFGGGFEFLQVNGLTFPTVVQFADQNGEFESALNLLPRSRIEDYPKPFCQVAIAFAKLTPTVEWTEGNANGERELISRVKGVLLPYVEQLRDDNAPRRVLSKYLAKPRFGGESDIFQELAKRNARVGDDPIEKDAQDDRKLAEMLHDGGWQLYGAHVALEFEGEKIIVAVGEYEMGWRTTGYSSLVAWKWDEGKAVYLLSADFLRIGSDPQIIVKDL